MVSIGREGPCVSPSPSGANVVAGHTGHSRQPQAGRGLCTPFPTGAALSQACRGHWAAPVKIPSLLNRALPVTLGSFLPSCASLHPFFPGLFLTHYRVRLPGREPLKGTPLAPLPIRQLAKLGPLVHAPLGATARGHANWPLPWSLGGRRHRFIQTSPGLREEAWEGSPEPMPRGEIGL